MNHLVAVGNSPGKQLLLFDVRENDAVSGANTFGVPRDLAKFYALALHSSNPNYIFTGADDGSISLWDTRKLSVSVYTVKAHDGMVTRFLLYYPCS